MIWGAIYEQIGVPILVKSVFDNNCLNKYEQFSFVSAYPPRIDLILSSKTSKLRFNMLVLFLVTPLGCLRPPNPLAPGGLRPLYRPALNRRTWWALVPWVMVQAWTMTRVYACTMATVHACTMAVVHACTMAVPWRSLDRSIRKLFTYFT